MKRRMEDFYYEMELTILKDTEYSSKFEVNRQQLLLPLLELPNKNVQIHVVECTGEFSLLISFNQSRYLVWTSLFRPTNRRLSRYRR